MSIKYKIVKNKMSEKELKATKTKYEKEFNSLMLLKKALKEVELASRLCSVNNRAVEYIKHGIQNNRFNMKELNLNKEFSEVELTSKKSWTFYPENVSDEFGITRYDKDNPINVSISKKFPINSKNLLESLREAKKDAIAVIQEYRKIRKETRFIEKEIDIPNIPFKPKYKVYVGGGYGASSGNNYTIHMVAGEIMRLKEELKLKKVFENKTPLTNEHHVAVEIEFISKGDKYDIAKKLAKVGVENYVTLKNDGSLRAEADYKHCHELCVISPQKEFKDVLQRVIKVLDEADSRVNKTCGLHVHIDVRNRDKEQVFANLVNAQDILYAMNPNSRLTGITEDGRNETCYSKRVTTTDFNLELAGTERYKGINAKSYTKHKTIEVRIHSGSTNFEKIFNWVCILLAIADKDKTYKTKVSDPELFVKRFDLDDQILAYIKQRVAKFNKDGKHITVSEVA